MLDLPSVRTFRLSRGGVECDEQGLRVGDLALLARDDRGAWKARDERDLGYDLSHVYGFQVDARAKMAGFGVVAKSLQDGNLAKAQIAALLLQLPDPPARTDAALGKSAERRLYYDLVACGLLKADADWDEQHPRTGSPPNAGWFASKPKDAGTDEPPRADAKPNQNASPGAEAPRSQFAFLSTGAVKAAESVLAENLSETVLKGLATLAARVSAASIIFGAIFIPSATPSVDEGPVPGRPNIRYRWAHAGSEVTFDALVDGQWQRLTTGQLRTDTGLFYDKDGQIVARLVYGAKRSTLVTNTDVLDNALARLRPGDREPDASAVPQDREPKLCPDPTLEPLTTYSENSIRYQEYVSKLVYGLAIYVRRVYFDGCDPKTGNLLEAKANIGFLFDRNDVEYYWAVKKYNFAYQMERQADAAKADGRNSVWHAQTMKGYRGLKKIAEELNRSNLFVVYDPNRPEKRK
jgi:Restriction endonuclease fold toxin 5